MKLVTIDLETFWSKTHSLSKMLPMAYCMSPETEIISCSVKVGDADTQVAFGEADVVDMLAGIDMSNALLAAHNMSGFDAMILAWRLKLRPAMWGCTLAMARPLHAKTCGLGLAKLVEHYGLGVKNNAVLMATQGRNLKDFTARERSEMAEYNKADVDQCAALFKKLRPHYSAAELWHIDATIRMLVEPQFEVDTGLLETALSVERSNKHKALMQLARIVVPGSDWDDEDAVAEVVRGHMASAPKFSELLTKRGVPTPMKPSPSDPSKQVPALAKTDAAFTDMQEHADPIVAAAARARLEVKSTITETRITAFLEAAAAAFGRLPVPLHYCGADTTGRWSGWAYNPQNLPRIGKLPKVSDALRRSLRAPKGFKIVVADQSGIELRVNMFLWKVPYAMELFRASPGKADLYKSLASDVFAVPYVDIQFEQRQAGKAMHLGCGFGLKNAEKFVAVAKALAQIDVSLDDARFYITGYGNKHPEISRGWKTCNEALSDIYLGKKEAVDPWGLVSTCPEGFALPSGRLIRYPALRQETLGEWADGRAKTSWVYAEGRHRSFIHGAKCDENIVQALARDTIADNALAVFRTTGLRPAHTVHDELIYVVPDSIAADLLDTLQQQMRKPPKWWPELVTWSEGDVADCYADAK